MSEDDPTGDGTEAPTNHGQRFDRLPATATEREVPGRATRVEVLAWWEERFGIDPAAFAEYTFWERGSGKVWALRGEEPSPIAVEGLGITFLRTRQDHWKPTLSAVQRFGHHATRNVLALDDQQAATFMAGEDQDLAWDGDWGYLVVTREIAGEQEPLGVGLYVYDELRSVVPKGRRREL
jgi:NOL1/NOP2/fmu family ribosome biogenesis protein